MARISVVGTPFEKALLNDIDKKQSLREHTINPPGQERYIRPIDVEALRAQLEVLAGGAVTTAEAEAVIANTVGADNVSLTTIATVAVAQVAQLVAGEIATDAQRQSIQDLLSYRLVETGSFLLSFHNGVIRGMLSVTDESGTPTPWIKVFNDDGDALFSL